MERYSDKILHSTPYDNPLLLSMATIEAQEGMASLKELKAGDVSQPTQLDTDQIAVYLVKAVSYTHLDVYKRQVRIRTARDLKYAEDGWIKKHLSVVGLRTVYELRGFRCFGFKETPDNRKTICVSRSLGAHLTSYDELSQAVAFYASLASEKLRAQRSLANAVTTYIATSFHTQDFYWGSRSVCLVTPKKDVYKRQGPSKASPFRTFTSNITSAVTSVV